MSIHPALSRLAMSMLVALTACGAPHAAPAEGDSARQSIVEIRSYRLKPGSRAEFDSLTRAVLPLLARHGIDVVLHGPSVHDETSYVLIRAFDDLADRDRKEAAFYGSVEWRDGPRQRVLELIEDFATVVLPLDAQAIAAMR